MLIFVLLSVGYGVLYADRQIKDVLLISGLVGAVLFLLVFYPIIWCQRYVEKKSEQVGLTEEELRYWKFYCFLTGVFGILVFYTKVVRGKGRERDS